MIEKLEIKNFKNLKDIKLEFSNLTVLSGKNGSGKSSIIQAFILIQENIKKHKKSLKEIDIMMKEKNTLRNKHTYQSNFTFDISNYGNELGFPNELLHQNAVNDIISFETFFDDLRINLDIDIKNKSDEENRYLRSVIAEVSINDLLEMDFPKFQYLHTNRISPKSNYSYSLEEDLYDIGFDGEKSAQYLYNNRSSEINLKKLKHPSSDSINFLDNVESWIHEVYEGLTFNFSTSPVSIEMKYKTKDLNPILPQNMGYGVTYVMPIIISILKANKGDLLIVENPETHLHPSAQIAIAKMISLASSQGVQIILETHSDHILNGIRRAVKENYIETDKVLFYNFNVKDYENIIKKITINKHGRLSEWPKDFFDEYEKQLMGLL